MNPAYADSYVGCDIATTAQFVASGAGLMVPPKVVKSKIVFRVLPPGAAGEKNALSGEIQANYVVIPKEAGDLVFQLKPGDLLKLMGEITLRVLAHPQHTNIKR